MSDAPKPELHTHFEWGKRYLEEHTPWDLGGPHPELAARLTEDALGRRRLGHGVRAFVPGCGRGWDAHALAEAGWLVTAVDLVPALGPVVTPLLDPFGGRFFACDALDYLSQPPFELLWEHTFFCALPRERRADYGAMARRAVGFRGHLAALVFPTDKTLEEGGPPHRTTVEDLAEALGDGFALITRERVTHPAPGRRWQEEWAVFRRTDVDED